MITPIFTLDQNNNELFILVQVPLLRSQDIEYTIDRFIFHCYAKPYYLKLFFPLPLAQDGLEHVTLDIEKNLLVFSIHKANPNENFPNLDLPSELLGPSSTPARSTGSLVSEISDGNYIDTNLLTDKLECLSFNFNDSEETILSDLYLPQHSSPPFVQSPGYGFNSMYTNFFKNSIKGFTLELFDLEYPDSTSIFERKQLQLEQELTLFDIDAYMFDFVDEEKNISRILLPSPLLAVSDLKLSETNHKQLISLGHKEYLIHKDNLKSIYYCALDILLAFSYNQRCFEKEWTCESTWLISKLSASISFLCVFKSLTSVLESFIRRSLCFPLYRNYNLAIQIIKDTATILESNGKRHILKIFLDLKELFDHDDVRYPISKLFLNDYCVWLQRSQDKHWSEISERMNLIQIPKESLPWPLVKYENILNEDTLNQSTDGEGSSDNDIYSSCVSNAEEETI